MELDGAALITATLINIHRTSGSAVSALDVHPFRESESKPRITRGNIKMLSQAVVPIINRQYGKR